MKFLVDNQLPSALARLIGTLGSEATHVLDVGLAQATDAEICKFAEANGYALVSKDEDFLYLALRPGASLSLVWVRIGNCRNRNLLNAFERAWLQMIERLQAGERIIELL